MVKTAFSALIALLIIVGISWFELAFVNQTFSEFRVILEGLYKKVQSDDATFEDGYAVREFWLEKKEVLHVWLPHTSIASVENELNEAMGYLRQGNTEDALPKIEILINMTLVIPEAYTISLKNVF